MRSTQLNIVLFDVDGVLIEDGGYYAALVATTDYYYQLMGAGQRPFDAALREQFHARGYVNEWDLCPLIAGILIVETLAQHPDLILRSAPFEDFLQQFRAVPVPQLAEVAPRYLEQIERAHGKPVERARDVLLKVLDQIHLAAGTRAPVEAVLREMFANTHDIENAPVTQIFQEFVVGSQLYRESYHLPPRFVAPSLLATEDRSLISSESKRKLTKWTQADKARICVYTARPSLPPSDSSNSSHTGYSPEAEIGMQLLEMNYPLIATGRVQWLAAQVNVPFESVTKPAPVQALAAIGAAMSHEEANSLLAAFALDARGELSGPLAALKDQPVNVWIVEDGILGMQATHSAIEVLKRSGVDIHAHAIGISAGGPKALALAPLSEMVLPDVNQAIEHIERAVLFAASSS